MRQPLSLKTQGLIAGLVLAFGAVVWLAREPVSAAVSGLFGTEQQAGSKGRARARGRSQGAVPVVVETVRQGRNDVVFSGVGTGRALRHVTLFPAVSGEVVKIHTHAGDQIAAGAEIVELDRRQAQLAVELAASKLKGAERLLSRADRLRRKRVQSEAKVLDAETLADQARVELKAAQEALKDHTIKAPFAGIVGIASIDIGDRVTSATELVTLDDRTKLTAEFDVPEQYLPRLRAGISVEARTPGFANRRFRGTLRRIDSRVHPTRRTVVVRTEIPNKEDLLRPGMSFAIDLKLPGGVYPQIPDLALQFSQRGNYVWLIDDGAARRVSVEIVKRQSNTVLVKGDVTPGDRIVVEGVQRLRPGRKVAVAETATDREQDKPRDLPAKVN